MAFKDYLPVFIVKFVKTIIFSLSLHNYPVQTLLYIFIQKGIQIIFTTIPVNDMVDTPFAFATKVAYVQF
jgi:hypothetical protein